MSELRYARPLPRFCLDEVNAAVEALCASSGLSPAKLFTIQLVLEELVTNTIKYGSADRPGEEIEIRLAARDGMAHLTITDNAGRFNPLESAEPNLSPDAEEREIGGLGLFLVLHKVQSLHYDYLDGRNVIEAVI